MSSSLEPSTSQGVKRRIELISSEPLPNGNDDTNNNILKTVGEFLNFKLFSEEAIAQLKDEKERANVAALNSSLQSLFHVSNGNIAADNVKLDQFEKIVKTLKSMKDNKPSMLTKAREVFKQIEETRMLIEDQTAEHNKKKLLEELRRELWRLSQANDPSEFMLTKKEVDRLKQLKAAIQKIQAMLHQLEEDDYGLDDLESNSSPLLQKIKLEKRLFSFWEESENILRRCPQYTGDTIYIKEFVYQRSNLPATVNQAVSTYFKAYLNKLRKYEAAKNRIRGSTADKKKVPQIDVIELNKYLQAEISKSTPTFKLSNELVDRIFTDLINEQKNRRLFQFFDQQFYYESQNSHEVMPDEGCSEELDKKLKANEERRETDLDKLEQEFVVKQHEQIGDKEIVEGFDGDNLIQLDDDDEDEDDDDEDEDDDDDDESEDEESGDDSLV